jgi:mRNA interferase RelE/StbE
VLQYKPAIPPEVQEVISHLPPGLKRSVRSAIRALAANPNTGDLLHDDLEGLRKYRVRRYRIVYRVMATARVVQILAVGERRTIYEELAQKARADRGES